MSTTTNYSTVDPYTGLPVARKVDLYVQGLFDFYSSGMQQLSPSLQTGQGGSVCAGGSV